MRLHGEVTTIGGLIAKADLAFVSRELTKLHEQLFHRKSHCLCLFHFRRPHFVEAGHFAPRRTARRVRLAPANLLRRRRLS